MLFAFAGMRCATRKTQPSSFPRRMKVEVRDGQFQLLATSRIRCRSANLKKKPNCLPMRLRPATGFALKIKSGKTKISAGDILVDDECSRCLARAGRL